MKAAFTGTAAILALLIVSGCTSSPAPDAHLSPLDVLFESGDGASPYDSATYRDAVKTCMAEQGFRWYPRPEAVATFTIEPTDQQLEEYGFGITTLAIPQKLLPSDLRGYEEHEGNADEPVDQNLAYLAQLSTAELGAYTEALEGASPLEPTSPGSESDVGQAATQEAQPATNDLGVSAPAELGCIGAARRHVPALKMRDDFAAELLDLEAKIFADPAFTAFEKSVVQCVRSHGIAFDGRERFAGQLAADLEPLIEASHKPAGLTTTHLDSLRRLQVAELLAAEALDSCGGNETNYMVKLREIAAPHERAFLAAQADQLGANADTASSE